MRTCLLIFLLLANPLLAATYYVDMGTGSDAANGTSTSTPFKHCPGDLLATGTAVSTTLSAGDTVIFKGGVSYTNSIMVNWSGTAGNAITYDGNSSETFGTGQALLDGKYLVTNGVPNLANYGAMLILTNRAFVTIRNFVIQHAGGVPIEAYPNYSCPTNDFYNFAPIWPTANTNFLPANFGFGIWCVDSTNIYVADSTIQEMCYWTNQSPVNSQTPGFNGTGILLSSCQNSTVSNCVFLREQIGVSLQSGFRSETLMSSNILVTGCSFGRFMNWQFLLAPATAGAIFAKCVLSNSTFTASPELGCTALWWTNYPTSWMATAGFAHFDAVFMGFGSYSNVVYTNIVEVGNTFTWDDVNGGGTSQNFLSNMGGDLKIINNVWKGQPQNLDSSSHSYSPIYVQDGPYLNGTTPVNYLIANNTFYTALGAITVRWSSPGNGGDPLLPPSRIRIFNNLIYNTNRNVFITPFSIQSTTNGFTDCDYNITTNSTTSGQTDMIYGWPTAGVDYQFSDWQGFGFDLHGQFTSAKFVDISHGFGTANSQNDLHLQATSPAIGAGTNLTAIFTTDQSGATRPSVGMWDVGAYQYSTNVIPPVTSTGGGWYPPQFMLR